MGRPDGWFNVGASTLIMCWWVGHQSKELTYYKTKMKIQKRKSIHGAVRLFGSEAMEYTKDRK